MRLCLMLFLLLLSRAVWADDFDALFSTWTDGFNKKDLTIACSLFSKNLTADYQGAPHKNYQTICDGFKKIFNEERQYHYRFKIHDVYRENNLAAVRITWHLKISEGKKIISETQDEGLDILQKNAQNEWKIINYLGYPIP